MTFCVIIKIMPLCIMVYLLLFTVSCTAGRSDKQAVVSPPPKGMVLVPAGEFIMGTDKKADPKKNMIGMRKAMYADEHPQRRISLKGFYIDKYEVTNKAFQKFVNKGKGEPPALWQGPSYPAGRDNYPVNGVTWFQAFGYCEFVGKRLPYEAEWEKSARGADGSEFPWGEKFDTKNKSRGNVGNQEIKDLYPVGSFEKGKSAYGVYDLVGNVWEWTGNWYKPYPGNNANLPDYGEVNRVLRGGGWGGGQGHYIIAHFFRSAHRFYARPYVSYPDVGFRCAKPVNAEEVTGKRFN